jgi:hypothetical protein
MRYTLRQEFPFPIKAVIEAREARYDALENQPGLKSQELLSQEIDGTVIITRRLFRFGEAIPEMVKKMVPAALLEMVDTNHFDVATNISRFTMQSEFSPDKIKIVATCPYLAIHEKLTAREYDVNVIVNIPLIGSAVGKAVAESHRQALIKDHEIMLQVCKRLADT